MPEFVDKALEKIKEKSKELRRRLKRKTPFEEFPTYKTRKPNEPIPPFKPQNTTGTLIDRRENAPTDWDPCDTDIDENDLEAVIQRCKDRIADNIMPQWWKDKLASYDDYKKRSDKFLVSEGDGLSIEVVLRLNRLEWLKKKLLREGDPRSSIPNIDAIMELYRDGTLKWHHGTATYWSKGNHLAGPKKFDINEFIDLTKVHGGQDAFWVELRDTPGLAMQYPVINHAIWPGGLPEQSHLIAYNLRFRLPDSRTGQQGWQFKVADDTGSSNVVIYEGDLNKIIQNNGTSVPFLYLLPVSGLMTDHSETRPIVGMVVVLEVRYTDPQERDVTEWSRWPVIVLPGKSIGRVRLGGPVLRRMFYTGTAPEASGKLFVSSKPQSLANMMPPRDHSTINTMPDPWSFQESSHVMPRGMKSPLYYTDAETLGDRQQLAAPLPGVVEAERSDREERGRRRVRAPRGHSSNPMRRGRGRGK